jgi:hypothetical protein
MEDGHLSPLLVEGNHNFSSRGSVLEIPCPLSECFKMASCGVTCARWIRNCGRERDLGDEAYRQVIETTFCLH